MLEEKEAIVYVLVVASALLNAGFEVERITRKTEDGLDALLGDMKILGVGIRSKTVFQLQDDVDGSVNQ